MLKTGKDHLDSLRDGRVVYIGSERVDDVTTHPAFCHAARTVAAIYDLKADPAQREVMAFDEDGTHYSMYFLMPRNRDDLTRRMRAHQQIADLTHGLFGRSPDHVSSFVTGMAMKPDICTAPKYDFADNIVRYYHHMRSNDLYTVYAVLPPQSARNPAFYQQQNLPVPTLQVVDEDDTGVIISGMKMLATGAVLANDLWIGNVLPLAPDQHAQAITCAIPVNQPGVSLWSRKPLERDAKTEFDSPMAYRYDETDSMVLCDRVHVPWDKVFVHNDPVLSRDVYIQTPAHCFGNHQSNVRFWSKLRLLVGLASRVTQATGAIEVPAVRDTLGRLAALEATLGGMIHGQIDAYEAWPAPYVCFNRRYMYAALNWCTENHSAIIDILRDLTGGGVFQMPADVSVLHDETLRQQFETYWQTPQYTAVERMKLFRLVWEFIGSEFAGRHMSYEKFYAGPSFIVRNHNFREAPWEAFHHLVDTLLASYDVPVRATDTT